MRLTKPTIISSLPIPVENNDILSTTLGQCNKLSPDLGTGKFCGLLQLYDKLLLARITVFRIETY